MARFILRPRTQADTKTENHTRLSVAPRRQRGKMQMDTGKLALLLRRPRSREYCEALRRLDAGGAHLSPELLDKFMKIIEEEFPEIAIRGTLIGIVSRCYLGDPYEVHTLDLTGDIIEHYKRGESLPEYMEKARGLALHGNYAFVEVYENACRAISEDGSLAVIMDEA